MKVWSGLSCLVLATGCALSGGSEVPPDEAPGEVAGAYGFPDLYSTLKDAESYFGRIPPSATIDVGTIDGKTGAFEGIVSEWITGPNGKPVRLVDTADIRAPRAILVFHVTNRGTSTFRVTVNGTVHTAAAGATSISIDVGTATSATWKVTVGTHSANDNFGISRSHFDALGAFTIPVMPLSVIYEPPQNAALTNGQTMSTANTLANLRSITATSDTSKTDQFDSDADFQNVCNGFATIFSAASGLKVDMPKLSTLFGDHKVTTTNGTTVTSQTSVEISTTQTQAIATNLHKGPGVGDVIVYLRNARMAWALVGGAVKLDLIDFDVLGVKAAQELKADYDAMVANPAITVGPRATLSKADTKVLLDLDPFVFGGADATLPGARFGLAASIDVGGASTTTGHSYTVTQSDLSAFAGYTTTVTDDTAGILSAVGLGVVSSSGHTATTVTQQASTRVTAGSTVGGNYTLSAGSGENYTMDVYYDRVYGNFAFKKRPMAAAAMR